MYYNNWMNNIGYDEVLDNWDENKIRELLLYHKIIKVEDDTLTLDNGTTLFFRGNEGCGGCSSGWYDVTELNTCDNVITDVEFVTDEEDEWEADKSYKIFVYAENQRIKIAQIDGSDGSGYYGTGYSIYVTLRDEKEK